MKDWTPAHQPFEDWLLAQGYVRSHGQPDDNLEIAWSTRIGYDCTVLSFCPWTTRNGLACVDAIVGHHASGTNPRLQIGTCESLADVKMIHEAIRVLNGYYQPESDRSMSPHAVTR